MPRLSVQKTQMIERIDGFNEKVIDHYSTTKNRRMDVSDLFVKKVPQLCYSNEAP